MEQNVIGSWTINIIISGKRFLGDLKITEDVIQLVAKYDMSLFDKSVPVIFQRQNDTMVCVIKPEDIVSVTSKTSLLNKRITLFVNDASGNPNEIILDYGVMSIEKMLNAVNTFTKNAKSL